MRVGIRFVALLTLAAVSIGTLPCDAEPVGEQQNLRAFANSSNDLGFRLLEELRKGDGSSNIFISPASIMLALSMVYNGADGVTRDQMRETLALQGMDIDSVNQAAQSIMQWLEEADSSVELAVANSIWKRKGFPFKDSFIDLMRDFYDSELFDLSTALPINDWVAENTKDKIKTIVDNVERDDVMFLINAIYFKGSWSQKFRESATRECDFHLASQEIIKHPLMENHGEYPYWEDSAVQAIKLPYGNKQFGMVVFLPRESVGIKRFLDGFSDDYWQQRKPYFGQRDGIIVLPRFEIEFDVCLNDTLKSLGMPAAFNPDEADFQNMWYKSGDSNIYIGEVLHKTYVKVNEEGTEAAAVTSVRMKKMESVSEPMPPFEMIVDRPFICAIVEEQTGMILFLGAIYDPRG